MGSLTVSIKCLDEPYLWRKDHLLFLELDIQSGGGGRRGGGSMKRRRKRGKEGEGGT